MIGILRSWLSRYMRNPGIVVFARVKSRRLPAKAMMEFHGKPVIWWTCYRALLTRFPVVLATPTANEDEVLHKAVEGLPVLHYRGYDDDVIGRFKAVADEFDEYAFDPLIRITHDDMFLNINALHKALRWRDADYVYCRRMIRGMDFEIVTRKLLDRCVAATKGKDSELMSYLFQRYCSNSAPVDIIDDDDDSVGLIRRLLLPRFWHGVVRGSKTDTRPIDNPRLELDYPEDAMLIRIVSGILGTMSPASWRIISLFRRMPELREINRLPKISVYTVAYNAASTIRRTITSVLNQEYDSKNWEYILYDDGSTDGTAAIMAEYAYHPNVKIARSPINRGVAMACNDAIKRARGDWYIRIDADDEMIGCALATLSEEIDRHPNAAVIYPRYLEVIDGVSPEAKWIPHAGGAIFNSKVMAKFKFLEGLRGGEGPEHYERLRDYGFETVVSENIVWLYNRKQGTLSNRKVG